MKNKYQVDIEKIKFYGEVLFFFKTALSFILLFFLVRATFLLEFPYYIITQICLGVLYLHMKELQHEALHEPVQRKSINRFIGTLLGIPMLISYSDYQYHHRLHHKYTGTHQDTEYFTYGKKNSLSLSNFILSIFMLEHYINNFKKMFNVLFLNKKITNNEKINIKIKHEYFLIFCFFLFFFYFYFQNNNLLLFKIWLVPTVLITLPLNVLIELPEHIFCRKEKNIFFNTRTIKSNFLISWIVNGNNYHVEHHCAPQYPISFLSKLHKEVKSNIIFYNKSYFGFYAQFFRNIKNNT